jgi:hypothetical protein
MDERETAANAADETCPRCGAHRTPDQEYCLECGLKLPTVTGRIASLRRSWIRRFGWYPGDWVWLSLLTLLIAAAGAAVAIAATEKTKDNGTTFVRVPTTGITTVHEPTPVGTTTAPPTVDTSTLPTAPEPTTSTPTKSAGPKNGQYAWPANRNGWTIVLVSYPKTTGLSAAQATATRAAHSGLTQVGLLDSSRYASLQPGYYVVFTGIYASKSDADAAVSTARQASFGGAYSRQIAR